MHNNTTLVKRAEEIAKAQGGRWPDHLATARAHLAREMAITHQAPPRAEIDYGADLLRKAHAAQSSRLLGGDPRTRIEIGDVDAGEFGRIMVEHDQSADLLLLHGLKVHLADISRDLRGAVVSTSAAFARAATDQEQSEQKSIIGFLVEAIARRHDAIGAKLREIVQGQRFTNV